jgi:hypothetical protein
LTPEERQRGLAYLDQHVVPAGEVLRFDGQETQVTAPSVVAFVDREPAANWGHDCRYLLVDLRSGEVTSIDARFPPFLRGVPETLRLVWRGEMAPAWAVAVEGEETSPDA